MADPGAIRQPLRNFRGRSEHGYRVAQSHGFTVVESPQSRNLIVFNGTAAQVESAFHTEIHNYATSDSKFYANSIEPSIPAAFSGVVAGFRGLNNFPVKPRAIKKAR